MNNSKEQTMLGVTIDNKLPFSTHIRELCEKSFSKNIGFVKNIKPTS